MSMDIQDVVVSPKHRGRVAASFMDRSVRVWSIPASPTDYAECLWVLNMDEHFVPKTLRFDTSGMDLWLFSAFSGFM